MTTKTSQAMGPVIHLVQCFLNLWQEGLKEVLQKEVDGQFMSKDHARDIFNAAGRKACDMADQAMVVAAEEMLAVEQAMEPPRPKLITLQEHHD